MIIDIDEARPLVRQIAKSGGVAISPHCLEQMEKRGVEMDDILYLLNWGDIGSNPHDKSGRRLLYREPISKE